MKPLLSALSLGITLTVGTMALPQTASAAPVLAGCMEDVAGFGLNCTANDIRIASLTNINVLDDGCAFPGDTVTFDATAELLLTAQARHDVGIYLATDGGDALNGSCQVDIIPFAPDPPFLDLDGLGDDPGGTIQDTCGDIDDLHNPVFHDLVGITVACIDQNNDGLLDLPSCLSWRQPGANDLCTHPLDAYPGSPAKCRCEILNSIPILVPPGAITVDKTASPTSLPEPGGPVTFTVQITNPSIVDVTVTSLIDNLHGNLDGQGTCSVPQLLTAGGGAYMCSFTANVSGGAGASETDVITASGTDTNGNPVSDLDDATVTITDVLPLIEVTKDATPTSVLEPGGPVTFDFVVSNPSTIETLTLTSLIDSIYGDLNGQGTCSVPQVIAVGGMYSCSFTTNVTGVDGDSETNIVTATGEDDDGNSVQDNDSATVNIVDVPPTIEVEKIAVPGSVLEPGGPVTFTFTIENTDTIEVVTIDTLTDTVYGNLDGQGTCSLPQVIPPLGSYTCSLIANVTGTPGSMHNNIVTASGEDDDGDQVSDSDSATVTIGNLPSSISVDKSVNEDLLQEPGGPVTFLVVIENTSAVDVVTIDTLTDSIYGNLHGRGTCSVPQIIAPGGSYLCSFTENVTGVGGDLEVDIVTASGTDDDGDPVSDDDDAQVRIINCGDGIVQPGEQCDDGNQTVGDGCSPNCTLELPFTPICRHPCPSKIRFRDGKPDKFYIKLGFFPTGPFNPLTCPMGITLSNANGVIWSGALMAGDLNKVGRRFMFKDKGALTGTGIRDGIRFMALTQRASDGLWRIQVKAFEDLSLATEAEMTVTLVACNDVFTKTATWNQKPKGWSVEFKKVP